jgi:hypothetical protein
MQLSELQNPTLSLLHAWKVETILSTTTGEKIPILKVERCFLESENEVRR